MDTIESLEDLEDGLQPVIPGKGFQEWLLDQNGTVATAGQE